jgi:hypothetical protein
MKSTKAEVQGRVLEVFKLRLGGAEFADIREYAAAPERSWGVSDSQLWRYIRSADALCKEHFDARAEHLLARHLLQRRQLYAHAMSAGDFRTALAVLKDEADLEALYPPGRVDLGDLTPAALEKEPDRKAHLARAVAFYGSIVARADVPLAERLRAQERIDRLLGLECIDIVARIEMLELVLKQKESAA